MSHLHPGEGAAEAPPRRRSARLRSQIHAGDESAGPARPRSARLRPQTDATGHGAGAASHRRSSRRSTQIHAIEEGAGVTRHRTKRLRPQTRASEEGDGVPRRRRLTSPEPPASVLDGEDMLREILLRLPLDLCSPPRASAVCKRWRGILVDPKFLRRFYAHHRKPPLLGVYEKCSFPKVELVFTPTPTLATTPNRIPAELFSLGQRHSRSPSSVLDCRHGRLLVLHGRELLVCDPISSKVRQVAVPEALFDSTEYQLRGAVLCAAGQQGHVHGACHSSPFKVVLVSYDSDSRRLLASVYSAETDTWGGLISRDHPYFPLLCPSTLVGNVLYWPLIWFLSINILRFDLDTQKITVIDGPPGAYYFDKLQIIQAADGTVGVAILHYDNLQMWQREVNSEGVAIWFRGKIVALRNILNIPPRTGRSTESLKLVGYDEDTDVIFLARHDGVHMVQIKSMQSRKLDGTPSPYYCYAFRSFYPLGTTIVGGTNGAEMLG